MMEYLNLFDSLPFPCLLLEVQEDTFYIRDLNKRYMEVSERKKEDLLGKEYPQSLPEKLTGVPENHKERLKSLRRAVKTKKASKTKCFRLDLSKREEEQTYWEVENIPILNEEGGIHRILNIAVEKTTEVQKEKEKQDLSRRLEENSEIRQHFSSTQSDGLYTLDTKGNFTSVNPALAELAEVPQEELLHMNFLPFCSDQDRQQILEYFRRCLQGEKHVFDARFISAKGRPVVLVISLVPLKKEGKIIGISGIARDISNYRETEEELLRSQRKYKALVQEGSDLTCILNSEGSFRFVSETFTSHLGAKPKELLGRNAFDFIHTEDKDRVMRNFSLLEQQKQVRIQPFRFADKEHNWRWMETTATDLRDDPHVQGIVANSKEVTELVERSEEVKELYERYRLAAEASQDMIYDWDLQEDSVLRFHKANQKMFGYEPDEIKLQDFWRNHIHPEELDAVERYQKKMLSDPRQKQLKVQCRLRRKDGSYAHIIDRAHIIRDQKGTAIRVIGATSDISEIVHSKNALRVSNKRFNYAMQATKEMIWDWDIKTDRIKRSRSFKKIFGHVIPKNASSRHFWMENIHPKDRSRVQESLKEALQDQERKKWRAEYCFLKKNGEEAHVIDRGFILRDKQGTPTRMVGAVLDVTESNRLLKEVKKQNKVLKEVAWEQAHVVRAPLARLMGLLNLLQHRNFGEWKEEELWDLVNQSAEELDEVIRKIVKKTEAVGAEKL